MILVAAVAAISALLMGCQEGNRKRNPPEKENIEQTKVDNADSLEKDSMKAIFERMQRWDALHGGMRQRESDK